MKSRLCLTVALASFAFLGSSGSALAGKSISLTKVWTHSTGVFNGVAAEIPAYDAKSGRLFVTDSNGSRVDILDVSTGDKVGDFSVAPGSPNGVSVYQGLVAVAVQDATKTNNGTVQFFDAATAEKLGQVTVGALPDMVTFTPNGQHVLVANEGEPNDLYTIDPEGTVSIISVKKNAKGLKQSDVVTIDFRAFNGQIAALRASGIRIYGPGATVAQDLEPEFIAVSDDSKTAWVTLQENNALGIIDIKSGKVTSLVPLGTKDHLASGQGLDASDRDNAINIANWPVRGMYQSDAIAAYKVHGKTYLVTANEGDARDYPGFAEEARVSSLALDPTAFPNGAALKNNANLGRLTVTRANGDTDNDGDYDQLFVLGGRSFSIWTAEGTQVFDSGDDFEQIAAARYPAAFNSSHDSNSSFDTRSDNKGPEPEGVALGKIRGRTYAFIGLERIGGVMVYDVTDPVAPEFVEYVNPRDFSGSPSAGTAGDLGPEGLIFLSKGETPFDADVLVVTNEVSGTTSLYRIDRLTSGNVVDELLDDVDLLIGQGYHQAVNGFEGLVGAPR